MASTAQIRCARCTMVVLHVFPQMMQDLMKFTGLPAKALYDKIMKSKAFRTKLSREEMTTIQTLTSNEYAGLDVTLIYKIAKFFNIYIPQPSRKWGSNPQHNEIEIGDDVERIRISRNAFVHSVKAEISEQELSDFFEKFISVGKRIDEYLDKPAGIQGYEDTIRNYRTISLDGEMAEHYIQALKEIETLKEKLTFTHAGKEIHIMAGRSMEDILRTIQDIDGESTTAVKFVIHDIADPEQKVALLNRLGAASFNTDNIHFKEAKLECIVVYVLIKNNVLQKSHSLDKEVRCFLKQMFDKLSLQKEPSEDLFVVMTSAEDDTEPYTHPTEPPEPSKSHDICSGNTSIILKLDIKNSAFKTQETLQQSMREFFANLVSATNGRELLREKDIHVLLQPDDTECLADTTEEDFVTSLTSNDSSLDTLYSDSEYAKAQSPVTDSPSPDVDSISLDDLTKAQCHLSSPSADLPNVPPKFYSAYRKHLNLERKNPWKHFFGFRRLIELKEKESSDVLTTFGNRKMYLIDALNDLENCNNTEINILLLRCFAKCCESDSLDSNDVFEILQYSLFLREPVVKFINDIGTRTFVQKKNYYPKPMKDLFTILLQLHLRNPNPILESCIRPVMEAVKQQQNSFSDIFDDNMWKTFNIFDKIDKNENTVTQKDTDQEFEKPSLKTHKKRERTNVSYKSKTRAEKGVKTPEKWRQVFGYQQLMKLKDANDEDVLETFRRNKLYLKDALNDKELIQDTDLASVILRCLAKSCKSSLTEIQIPIFETVIDSTFFKCDILSFMNSAAMSPSTYSKFPLKQSIADIFNIFDTLVILLPDVSPVMHKTLMDMNTSINVLHAQQENQSVDGELWEIYHRLLIKTQPR